MELNHGLLFSLRHPGAVTGRDRHGLGGGGQSVPGRPERRAHAICSGARPQRGILEREPPAPILHHHRPSIIRGITSRSSRQPQLVIVVEQGLIALRAASTHSAGQPSPSLTPATTGCCSFAVPGRDRLVVAKRRASCRRREKSTWTVEGKHPVELTGTRVPGHGEMPYLTRGGHAFTGSRWRRPAPATRRPGRALHAADPRRPRAQPAGRDDRWRGGRATGFPVHRPLVCGSRARVTRGEIQDGVAGGCTCHRARAVWRGRGRQFRLPWPRFDGSAVGPSVLGSSATGTATCRARRHGGGAPARDLLDAMGAQRRVAVEGGVIEAKLPPIPSRRGRARNIAGSTPRRHPFGDAIAEDVPPLRRGRVAAWSSGVPHAQAPGRRRRWWVRSELARGRGARATMPV